MGYTITIGELDVRKQPDDGLDCCCISFGAGGTSHNTAPAFGEPTDYTNSRLTSYITWSNFMQDTGLYDAFFTERGYLIGGHPGVRLVTKDLVDCVSVALTSYKNQNAGLEPRLDEGKEAQGWLCRLIWLDYWLKWSLDNCQTPVIANS